MKSFKYRENTAFGYKRINSWNTRKPSTKVIKYFYENKVVGERPQHHIGQCQKLNNVYYYQEDIKFSSVLEVFKFHAESLN